MGCVHVIGPLGGTDRNPQTPLATLEGETDTELLGRLEYLQHPFAEKHDDDWRFIEMLNVARAILKRRKEA